MIVLIPLHQSRLETIEQYSVDYSVRVLKNRRLCFFGPANLERNYYESRYPNIPYATFDDHHFTSIQEYCRLMLSEKFYQRFARYEFMLLMQPDAIVLRDELDWWCQQPYDYVGAPWPAGHISLSFGDGKTISPSVGNGGLSLRRVEQCRVLLASTASVAETWRKAGLNEDLFFSGMAVLKPSFRVPDDYLASRFAMEWGPSHYFSMNGGCLPMGGHAWFKFEPHFWLPLLGCNKKTDLSNQPLSNLERRGRHVIFAAQAKRQHYASLKFSDNEIFLGPDIETFYDQTGQLKEKHVEAGAWNLFDELASIKEGHKAAWTPELVVVLADSTRRSLPKNVHLADSKTALLLGDTHHLDKPITNLFHYASTEQFDTLVTMFDRHHLHFFTNTQTQVAWLPNLCWQPHWHPAPVQAPAPSVVFIGQAGSFHPYRRWLLQQLHAAGLPLHAQRANQADAACAYNNAAVALNVSLNGDLNLRIFEILAAGGLLLTDRLSKASGLERILTPGEHYLDYGSLEECIEKIRWVFAHPEDALRIRRQGRAYIEEHFRPERQMQRFWDLIDHGRIDPMLRLDDEPRCQHSPADPTEIMARIACYETVQERHLHSQSVILFAQHHRAVHQPWLEDVSDLPRLRTQSLDALATMPPPPPRVTGELSAQEHILALSAEDLADAELESTRYWLDCFQGCTLLLWGADWDIPIIRQRLDELLQPRGFHLIDNKDFEPGRIYQLVHHTSS
jgi:hypothetical protein